MLPYSYVRGASMDFEQLLCTPDSEPAVFDQSANVQDVRGVRSPIVPVRALTAAERRKVQRAARKVLERRAVDTEQTEILQHLFRMADGATIRRERSVQ